MTGEDKEKPYRLWSGPAGKEENDLLSRPDVQDRRQRLQALLSQWLRMENLITLLGAGCSYSQGGKLLGGLEKAVLEYLAALYEQDKTEDGSESTPSRIIQQRETAKLIDGPGFEQWCGSAWNKGSDSISVQGVVVWPYGEAPCRRSHQCAEVASKAHCCRQG